MITKIDLRTRRYFIKNEGNSFFFSKSRVIKDSKNGLDTCVKDYKSRVMIFFGFFKSQTHKYKLRLGQQKGQI